ncbi:cupin-like domain-containing protein [Xenorhabdus nematophila]|uniref:cupin-like domain-containing protein n=1 Tax=Xenorhabdus nematophila TaxID=628 RepID=UPI000AAC42A0|nr:cupin-like domain-containing protein [Xenorhabdus nematophila]
MGCVVEVTRFDQNECHRTLAQGCAIVFRGLLKDWPAIERWGADYFQAKCPQIDVIIKFFDADGVRFEPAKMYRYLELLNEYKKGEKGGSIPYCHDIPIFLQAQQLLDDIGDFPLMALPKLYREDWWQFVQFFMSPAGAVTPLHFDTLRTNNLFFQIQGSKRFTFIPWEERNACSRRGWRWFEYNPEIQGDNKFVNISNCTIEVHQGDMLLMPAGMLHHVRTLTDSISFNIDFHTRSSAIASFKSIKEKMPRENLYYNGLSLCGLLGLIKRERFFREVPSVP